VQIGTAFLATDESNATAIHKQMLFSDASRYTTIVTERLPGGLGRGITSRIAKDLVNKEEGFLPFPFQTQFMSPLRKAAIEQEKWDMLLFWSGQIAPVLKYTKAGELMESILADTAAYFDHFKP
jgi:nitronate monooxygenase